MALPYRLRSITKPFEPALEHLNRCTMRFTVQQVRNGCRLGSLTDLGPQPLATPLWMMYTLQGSAPYLTSDVLSKISDTPSVMIVPNGHVSEHYDAIQKYNKGIAAFASLPEKLVFASMQDPGVATPTGFNTNKGVAVWGRPGKTEMTVEMHTRLTEALRPCVYQAMFDGDTPKDASNKRMKKSVDRSIQFLDLCLEEKKKSEVLRDVPMFAGIVGGYNKYERARFAKEVSKRDVSGYSIEGFHHNGSKVEELKISEISDLLQISLNELSEDKPRVFTGALPPHSLLAAIKLGLDIFDLSYPYVVGERGSALTFNYVFDAQTQEQELSHSVEGEEGPYEMCLKHKRFARDFGPLKQGCECYTCVHHSRAYVHHLLEVSELLAPILLTIHNMQHYIGFTQQIHKCLRDDSFDQLQMLIESQRTLKG
ncbi:hypothetical protein CAPTEDRAFT_225931 [Capitella teleta]|uniref:Queuine tRNA-ribosyltransferase accessory subunit 2 n=1 Tax=Capitella teleta TaxID=283909 RepID=R7TBT1_CAPTE|nr:hypothetical protein CAPTEDRAFT_225931 [Capitella teleta]|eukprot:ELT91169.1 hypothetical protein CAPTEDRAFT_225931 [Capitella teleta]